MSTSAITTSSKVQVSASWTNRHATAKTAESSSAAGWLYHPLAIGLCTALGGGFTAAIMGGVNLVRGGSFIRPWLSATWILALALGQAAFLAAFVMTPLAESSRSWILGIYAAMGMVACLMAWLVCHSSSRASWAIRTSHTGWLNCLPPVALGLMLNVIVILTLVDLRSGW